MATTKKAAVKKTVKKAAVKKPMVRQAFVIDASGSMIRITDQVLSAMNGLCRIVSAESAKTPTRVSMFRFSDETHMIIEDQDATQLPVLTRKEYTPNGSTALFDAVNEAIKSLQKFGKSNDIYVVNVFTDGFNNVGAHRVAGIVKTMTELTELGNWTFTFQLPKGYSKIFSDSHKVPLGNVTEWEATESGAHDMGQAAQTATAGFYDQVRSGATQTRGFYQPDLSKMKAKDIAKLDDLSHKFKAYEVEKETPIKEFVEEKTKRGYVIGSTYYALTKKETVQAQKDVLLLDIKSKKIYGGDQARGLIGLPQGVEAKVEPGNHGNYIIYVKSTSVNRKLVRGTKILVDTTKIANDPSTWDHTKVGRGPVADGRRAAKKRGK